MWVDDRPGVLGALATRLGRLDGDVIGLEVVERGAGRVIDEVALTLPMNASALEVISELNTLDGVDVEGIRPAGSGRRTRPELLTAAAELVKPTNESASYVLCRFVAEDLRSDWCAVVVDGVVRAAKGPTPPLEWLAAFDSGAAASPTELVVADGVMRAQRDNVSLLVGRADIEFLDSEGHELCAWTSLGHAVLSVAHGNR